MEAGVKEDTVMLTVAGIELPLEIKGQVSIADRVKEIEIQRIEAFTKEELTPEKIDEISMEAMQAKLHAADGQTGMCSALIYISLVERDGVEGVETIMVPGDPNQEPVHRFKAVSHNRLKSELINTRKTVTNARRPSAYKQPAEYIYKRTIDLIYDDLILDELETNLNINHLQLIPNDPALQNIPWAALYDINKIRYIYDDQNIDGTPEKDMYLIEQFSLAVSPSFHMTKPQHHDMRNAERFVLAETDFNTLEPLPAILPEFNLVNPSPDVDEIPTDSKFNQDNLAMVMNQLSNSTGKQILHVSTHADFKSGGNPVTDYIAAQNGANDNVTLDELSVHDFSNLELAVLSVCRTGLGNENYEYGFGGAAWGKGAESAMASLWYISDVGTSALMQAFYHELSTRDIPLAKIQQKVVRAMMEGRIRYEGGANPRIIYQFGSQGEESFSIPPEVAQNLNFGINYQHPYYWSAFSIIGSGH